MIYTTYKEWRAARTEAFNHAARQYQLQCARHVIKLAPLPEFYEVLTALEIFDKSPTRERDWRPRLQELYDQLFRGKRSSHHRYGYTALGEILLGLSFAVHNALHPPKNCGSWFTQRFTEACFLAAAIIDPLDDGITMLPDRALHAEGDWQSGVWKKVWVEYNAEWGCTWTEYKFRQEQKETRAA